MPDNFVVPPMPPQLLDALKRQYGPNGPPMPGAGAMMAPPSPMMQPGMPGGPPAPALPLGGRMAPPAPAVVPPAGPINMLAKGGVNQAPPGPPGAAPFLPAGTGTPGATAPPKLPAVTDDPGVKGGMGEIPKPQDLGSYLNPALQKFQADQAGYNQADEANRIDPQQVKPRLWERLAGFALGATQLKDPQNAGAVASEVVDRRRVGSEQARNTALAPWTQRLQQDKEGLPLAEASARTGYEQGELDLRRESEITQRFSALSNADYKQDIVDVRNEIAKGNIDKAENLLDQRQKVLEQQKVHDKEWYDMQHLMLDLRSRIEDRKEAEGTKMKPGQVNATEDRKKADIQKAHAAYAKATKDLPTDPKAEWTEEQKGTLAQAKEDYDQSVQDSEDNYVNKINETGGTAERQDVTSDPAWRGKGAAAPPATPAAKPTASDEPPIKMGPAGEKPTKTATEPNSKAKIGLYKSTGQWMLVPQTGGSK